MDPIENIQATAHELVAFARVLGTNLECIEGHFEKNRRWIFLWRKDERPYSGPAGEELGTLHYNMQGTISKLPNTFRQSARAFHGGWSEAGTLATIEQAYELVKGWLVDEREVDELPRRQIRRCQIC